MPKDRMPEEISKDIFGDKRSDSIPEVLKNV
jgi:hypothetical protein